MKQLIRFLCNRPVVINGIMNKVLLEVEPS